jgi:hypothetical protein
MHMVAENLLPDISASAGSWIFPDEIIHQR